MRKVIDFQTYSHLRKMSFNDMSRWVMSIYKSAYQDGYAESVKEQVVLDEPELYNTLLSIPGIGPKTADKIINVLKEKQA